ncbi:MAG: class I SAM-dependent methyltransferase, partial [Pseudomonadota bacterium]
YFQVVSQRLRAGGVAVLQAITIREDLYEDYRSNPDFIQRYIFPGGMLPTVSIMQRHAERAGLQFEVHEQFGQSYAKTLADWRARFVDMWPRIEALGFDDRFRRMWMYYLDYCEVGFSRGTIDVGLFRLRKPSDQPQKIISKNHQPILLEQG